MKLHSPRLERVLRRRVRKEIRASPRLKREARAGSMRSHVRAGAGIARTLSTAVFIAATLAAGSRTGHFESGLAMVALWAAFFLFIQPQKLLAKLFLAQDVQTLSHLPITSADIFRRQLGEYFRSTLWLLTDLVLAYAMLAGCDTAPPGFGWAVIPAGVATWLITISLALIGLMHFPRFPFLAVAALPWMGLCFVVVLNEWFGTVAGTIGLLDRYAPDLLLVLPTGWPAEHTLAAAGQRHWLLFILVIPIGLFALLAFNVLVKIGREYRITEPVLPESPDLLPGQKPGPAAPVVPTEFPPARVGLSEIEEAVLERQFLAPGWATSRGWLERRLWGKLSPREKGLVDFAFPNGYELTRKWKGIFRNMIIAWLITGGLALAKQFTAAAGFGIISLFVNGFQMLLPFFARGRAFNGVYNNGMATPIYAGLPVGFDELARTLLRFSAVQLPLVALWSLAWGIVLMIPARPPLWYGAVAGVKLTGILFAGRYIILMGCFSSGSNDSRRFRINTIPLLIFVSVFGVLYLICGGASMFVPDQRIAWGLFAAACACALLLFYGYRWFYHRSRLDLLV